MRRIFLVMAVAVLFAACSSEKAALQSAEQFGCHITPEQARQAAETACASVALGPITMNGYDQDTRVEMQNVPRTMSISAPLKMPNGDVAAEVACEVNTVHHSVIYAQITRGPTSKEEADYLRSLGACGG
jgi:hypothetical protein